ncbi:MAG: YbbR-like domain-containing protein [Holophagales bacterium]|nr:YbbR-like domain-containing protein [Holophagales bacterium]MXX62480.1 YbbR-like domain-containing protein [Holophagales bacterium]MYC11721.1 YbbR-like domain-containing protein [Holophagales bacterium]MYD23946.1 YbbR-like domain-containing protein [Holophagales bacterium]MYI33501.1 YbbR-like domain-containing protein [Holophagales bacterium]
MSENGNRWTFRALAVVIAIGIWLPASFCPRLREMTTPPSEENVQARLTIPDHERLTVLSFEPAGVDVRIRGSDERIASLDLDQIRVQVPLPDDVFVGGAYGGPRVVEIDLAPEDVLLPDEEVEVVSVIPDRLTLRVDEEILVSVPVQVDTIGEPIGGVSVDYDNVRIEPPRVTVRGSRSEINKLEVAVAGPVDITGRGVDFTAAQVRVRFNSEHVQVEFPTIVDVFVPMVSRQPQSSGAGS